jgi:hypothetical protein
MIWLKKYQNTNHIIITPISLVFLHRLNTQYYENFNWK